MLAKVVGLLPHSWITAVARLQWRHPRLKRAVDWMANRFRNQDGIIQQGVGRGLKFNAGGANAGYLLGTTEPEVQEALASLIQPQMVVYDIGANVGFYTMIAARLVGTEGRVIAFEPLQVNASQAIHNAQLNNFSHVQVHDEALGNEDGETLFFTSTIPTLGRFAKFGAPDETSSETTVKVRKLDTLMREGLPAPDLIKMDVEGAEVDVLEGARQLIATRRPLMLIELHGTNEQVASFLEEYGYEIKVLGCDDDIRAARWSAHVTAVPSSLL